MALGASLIMLTTSTIYFRMGSCVLSILSIIERVSSAIFRYTLSFPIRHRHLKYSITILKSFWGRRRGYGLDEVPIDVFVHLRQDQHVQVGALHLRDELEQDLVVVGQGHLLVLPDLLEVAQQALRITAALPASCRAACP